MINSRLLKPQLSLHIYLVRGTPLIRDALYLSVVPDPPWHPQFLRPSTSLKKEDTGGSVNETSPMTQVPSLEPKVGGEKQLSKVAA